MVTFDDIPGQSSTTGVVPDGYKNLTWANTEYVNTSTTLANSSYRTGLRSSPFVAYNTNDTNIRFASKAGTYLNFLFFQITRTLSFPHTVTVSISRNEVGIVQTSLKVSTHFSMIFPCTDCVGTNTITIDQTFNESYRPLLPAGTHIIIDDVCILQ